MCLSVLETACRAVVCAIKMQCVCVCVCVGTCLRCTGLHWICFGDEEQGFGWVSLGIYG